MLFFSVVSYVIRVIFVNIYNNIGLSSSFAQCSVSCGQGVQRRLVVCQLNNGTYLNDKACDVTYKPKTEQICENRKCPQIAKWVTSDWQPVYDWFNTFLNSKIKCFPAATLFRLNLQIKCWLVTWLSLFYVNVFYLYMPLCFRNRHMRIDALCIYQPEFYG